MDRRKLFPTPHIEAWGRLLLAHKVLIERIQKALAAAGLPPLEWYDVLLALALRDERRMRLHQLGDWVALSRSNLTRLCDRLEKAGAIERVRSPEDGRGQFAQMTPAGAALLKKMWPVYRRSIESHFARHYSGREAAGLAELLKRPLHGCKHQLPD
jgi:DNA-binding MarR family transcriptional regulator